MKSAQKELLCVLLRRLQELELIEKSTCLRAIDLIYSDMELPELFRYSVCRAEEGNRNQCAETTQ